MNENRAATDNMLSQVEVPEQGTRRDEYNYRHAEVYAQLYIGDSLQKLANAVDRVGERLDRFPTSRKAWRTGRR